MRSTTVVPPFYDSEPGAPPPLPPMLTDQLELIIPTAKASSSTPAPEFKLAKQMRKHSDRSSSPYTKKATSNSTHPHS
ncbi:hypothetical protein BDR07DRAFT_1485330 [Suillus spraguei]|nr:hypothetical protein BDR07DRAFT_1485330 [Suillus spraguei]